MCNPETATTAAGGDKDDGLEDLVRSDPSIAYSQCVWPVFDFFWNSKLNRVIHPLGLAAIYLGIGALWYLLEGLTLARTVVLVVGALPVLGSALFLVMGILMISKNRQPAFRSAQDVLLERIRSGRAKRKPDAYDVYFPVPSSDTTNTVGMLFYPGALVNHTAYAPMAAALSDKGILVVVLSLEPIRFIADLETNQQLAKQAMSDLASSGVDEWVLAGHSAGAMTALNIANAAEANPNPNPSFGRVVACGIAEFGLAKVAYKLRNSPVKVLLLNATEDGVIEQSSPKAKEEFLTKFLPPPDKGSAKGGRTTCVTIEGGNHAGFAHYGPQSMDGVRTISLEDQQRQLVDYTSEFLSSVEGSSERKDKNL
jgi:hypothetical protein